MCGIAGFKQTKASSDAQMNADIKSMLGTLEHRGPDSNGDWTNQAQKLVFGQQRLAIIDLTPGGHQPMLSDSQHIAITFNGEIYNYQEIRKELEATGMSFRSSSDTEVLLKGYMYWGTAVLEKLVGMFAFAIWDEDKEQLFLARDRAGEKPLYYADSAHGFAFASELDALTRLDWVDTSIDQDALSLYLSLQYVPSPYSIYRGVKKLAPAHAMILNNQGSEIWRYWDPVKTVGQGQLAMSEEDALAELERLIFQAVKGQMIADVPLGAFLSGGIDSSTVVSVMSELSSRSVQTFTIGFEEAENNEADHAAAVANFLGTQHTCEYLTEKDALALIPSLPSMYGEPFADASALPTHLVSRVARQHVTVSLSGDGGDEAFGGYERYNSLEKIEPWMQMLAPLGPVMRPLKSVLPRRAALATPYLGKHLGHMYRALVGMFKEDEVIIMTGTLPDYLDYERAWKVEGISNRRRAMLADMLSYMPEAVLTKVDRAAMAISLETRAPLLDHRILDFSLRLPDQFVKNKAILKKFVYGRIPQNLLDRPKQGFGVPIGAWLNKDLKDLLFDTVTKSNLEGVGISNTAFVDNLIQEHVSGKVNHELRLWTLLNLCSWYEAKK